jgi:hypothetical protein
MATKTRTQVVVYQVDEEGRTGEKVGTGSLIDMLVALVCPSPGVELGDKPDAAKLRFGIGSLGDDGGIIEVIDGDGIIDVYEHGGVPHFAVVLASASAAAADQIFPDGTKPSEENLERAVTTYLDKAAPPDAAAPAAQPKNLPLPGAPKGSWYCHIKPNAPQCKKK